MSKMTPAAVERDLNDALFGFKDKASQIKADHKAAKEEIQKDSRRSPIAKKEDLAALTAATRNKLAALKTDQTSYVKDLRDRVEREFRGSLATDSASVMSRRDASARARKLDRAEAMEALQEALAGNDIDFAQAIYGKARNVAWIDVAEAYQAANPTTAGSAEALSYIDEMTTGGAYNLAAGITFSSPD